MSEHLLSVKDLHTSFTTDNGEVHAVNGVSFNLDAGKVLGIVGESGSGKSVTAYSIMQILAENGRITGGSVEYKGEDITKWNKKQMAAFRGKCCSIIFQDPMTSLNPVFSIGNQLEEAIRMHTDKNHKQARERAVELLTLVGVNEPTKRIKQYPFELSGGMARRVLLASAVMEHPQFIIADEPTPGLDVKAAQLVLSHFRELASEGTAVLFITHDLELALTVAHRVAVFYAGETIEEADAECFLSGRLGHPFTQALWNAMPQRGFQALAGAQPYPGEVEQGCPFRDQCPHPGRDCGENSIPLLPYGNGAVRCLYPDQGGVAEC